METVEISLFGRGTDGEPFLPELWPAVRLSNFLRNRHPAETEDSVVTVNRLPNGPVGIQTDLQPMRVQTPGQGESRSSTRRTDPGEAETNPHPTSTPGIASNTRIAEFNGPGAHLQQQLNTTFLAQANDSTVAQSEGRPRRAVTQQIIVDPERTGGGATTTRAYNNIVNFTRNVRPHVELTAQLRKEGVRSVNDLDFSRRASPTWTPSIGPIRITPSISSSMMRRSAGAFSRRLLRT